MKKSIIPFFLFLLAAGMVGCSDNDTDLVNDLVYDDEPVVELTGTGQLKAVWSADSKGKKDFLMHEYEYNDKGNISRVNNGYYAGEDGKKRFMSYENYIYDEAGSLERIDYYNYNTSRGYILLEQKKYSYSSDGLLEKEESYYPIPDYSNHILYAYEDGVLKAEEHYDEQNRRTLKKEYIYNKSGVLVEELDYYSGDKANRHTFHSYINGLRCKTDIYDGENQQIHFMTISRQFDKNNNLVREETEVLASYSSMAGGTVIYDYF